MTKPQDVDECSRACGCYASMIGKQFLTPHPRSEGVVTVLAIHEPQYPFEVPLASVRFDGDHPAGYKDGSYGMYEAFMFGLISNLRLKSGKPNPAKTFEKTFPLTFTVFEMVLPY